MKAPKSIWAWTLPLLALGGPIPAAERYSIRQDRAQGGQRPLLVILSDAKEGVEAAIAPSEGGELSSLRVRWNGRWQELIWRARDYHPTSGWRGKAPLLWPATGRNFAPGDKADGGDDVVGSYDWGGRRYAMPIHGFVRRMPWKQLRRQAGASGAVLALEVADTPETRRCYPFGFRLEVEYKLFEGRLTMLYTVRAAEGNVAPMPFSIGNHITFRMPLVEGSDASRVILRSLATVEYLKSPEGLPTGVAQPWTMGPEMLLGAWKDRLARSLGGYRGDPWLEMADPGGLTLRIDHKADSLPAAPLVLFNLWGMPVEGYFSPEPWVGLQNSLVLKKGLVELQAGGVWRWQVELSMRVLPSPAGQSGMVALSPLSPLRDSLVWSLCPLCPPRDSLVWSLRPLRPLRDSLVWSLCPLRPLRDSLVWSLCPLRPLLRQLTRKHPRSPTHSPSGAAIAGRSAPLGPSSHSTVTPAVSPSSSSKVSSPKGDYSTSNGAGDAPASDYAGYSLVRSLCLRQPHMGRCSGPCAAGDCGGSTDIACPHTPAGS